MKNTQKIAIGVLVVLFIGAAIYFTDSTSQKGAIIPKNKPVDNRPDLVARDFYVDQGSTNDGIVTVGETVTLFVNIQNQGFTASSGSTSTFYVDGAAYIQRPTGPLNPNTVEVEDSAAWIPQRDGSIELRACADTYNLVAEANEQNNCLTTHLTVLSSADEAPASADNQQTGNTNNSQSDTSGGDLNNASGQTYSGSGRSTRR